MDKYSIDKRVYFTVTIMPAKVCDINYFTNSYLSSFFKQNYEYFL
jgi:hypothetical protein